MSYEKRLFMGLALAVVLPAAIVITINCTRPLTVSNLPASEQEVIRSIRSLGINVSTGSFSCDFRSRGLLVLSRDTSDGVCHVVEFELLPSLAAPIGVKHIGRDEMVDKLTFKLVKLGHLKRVVLHGAPKSSIARLHRLLPDCSLVTKLSDDRPDSAHVVM